MKTLFFTVFLASCVVTVCAGVSAAAATAAADDKAVLLEAMPILNGPGPLSSCFDGWNVSKSLSSFSEVNSDASGFVLQLWLGSCGLQGQLPRGLSKLTQLQILIVSDNKLIGELPPEWSNMTKLQELYLYNNKLSGELPSEWSNMPQLQRLAFSNNKLSGELPSEWSNMPQLQMLFLYNNELSGELPSEWSSMTQLVWLYLSSNKLSGELPPEWSNMPQLQVLYLSNNQLSGELPPEWSNMPQLQWLYLSNNQLSGELPSEWSNMPQLQGLGFSNNKLSGELPSEWSNMTKLQGLDFSNNKLSGELPPEWSSMTQLQGLDFSNNKLTSAPGSSFPPDSWSNMHHMQYFSAANNSFRGSFSIAVAKSWRSSATVIDVSANCLDVSTAVLDILLGNSTVKKFDATPGSCLEMQPLVTSAQLAGPYRYSSVNTFRDDPTMCQGRGNYGCPSTTLSATLSGRRITMSVLCDNGALSVKSVIPITSSCISVLYRPLLECFVDAAATVPCDSKSEHLQLPPWQNVTQLATSTSNAWTFDGVFDSALHGAHYRYRIDAGLNFFPGFLTDRNGPLNVNFTNVTAHTALFQPPPCPVNDTFAVNLSTTCAPCPDLARCNGTTSLVLANETPAWRPAEHLLPLVACPNRFTRGCRVNPNETEDFHSGATCRDNFTGPLCTRCSEGYGMDSDRECTECPSRAASITLFCVSTLILILLATALVMLSVKPTRKKKNSVEEGETTFGDDAAAEGEPSSRCSSCISEERKAQIKSIGRRGVGVLRQLINHVSLIGALWYSTSAVDLKGTLRRTLGIVEGTNSFFFSSFASTSLSCLNSDWSPTAARFVSLLVVFGVVFVLVSLFFLIKTRSGRAAVTVGLFLSFLAYSPLTSYVTKLLSACNSYDFFVASEYVQNRRDAPVKSYSLLSSDLAQNCSSDATNTLRSGAVATLVLFSIGLPVAASAAYRLLASKQELRREVFLFLTEKYRPTAWYFEIVAINGRKLAMALIMGALSAESQSALQLQLYSAVCAVMLALSVGLKPLQRNASNVVDQLSLSSAILAAAFISAVSASPDDDGLQIAAAVFVLLTQVIVVVAIFGVGFEWIAAATSDAEGEGEDASAMSSPGLQEPLVRTTGAAPSELGTIDGADSEGADDDQHRAFVPPTAFSAAQQKRIDELERENQQQRAENDKQKHGLEGLRREIEQQRLQIEHSAQETARQKQEMERQKQEMERQKQEIEALRAQISVLDKNGRNEEKISQ